jgi:ribose 5-phosphate isomerase A
MLWQEKAKKRVAFEAIEHVKDNFIVGLGSGSTAAYAIQEIGKLIQQDNLRILAIPSSSQARILAIQSGVPLTTLDEHPILDLVIDGADEIDKKLDMIKGGGGALTREKIVASVAKQVVIIADETKLVNNLGTSFRVPLEVLPFALTTCIKDLKNLGGNAILREGSGKVGAVVTDNGNYIVDVDFGPIDNAEKLNHQLKLIPGVIETGLFLGLANLVYLGKPDGIIKLKK